MNVRDYYFKLKGMQDLIDTERGTPTYGLSLRRRLSLWRNGFLTRSGVLYDLETHGPELFVSDYERDVRTKTINGTWSVALSNKLFFDWLMRSYDEHRMIVYGIARNGRFHEYDDRQGPPATGTDGTPTPDVDAVVQSTASGAVHHAGRWVADRLDQDERLVLKWVNGGGGNNVLLCSRAENGYRINGDRYDRAALIRRIDDLDDYLVCEFVEQGAYSAAFYPDTPNTLRLITMYDEDAGEAFIGAAIQRMGSSVSGSMDNFSQGGLNAKIDVETGTLGAGVQLPIDDRRVGRYGDHPDTGTRIERVTIPAWDLIRERVCALASDHPMIPYVGWDLLLTDDEGSFKIIEANSYPGLKSIQVHGPLLADDRVRRFYERHGVC
jgi:hypothetical protein